MPKYVVLVERCAFDSKAIEVDAPNQEEAEAFVTQQLAGPYGFEMLTVVEQSLTPDEESRWEIVDGWEKH
jgi:hypothetical protein